MSKDGKRILYVSSELVPYFSETPLSSYSLEAPKAMKKKGHDVRIFMPRFGMINERRHQLHEVIRLSGMNLIINDIDQPLIIKVASIPKERLQVYFIDNDEFFKRKQVSEDKKGVPFEDNDERIIFFAKGVLETVKKLNWKPDIIHIHGWMASLVPLYIKKFYSNDPFFNEAKTVVSLFNNSFEGAMNEKIVEKLKFDGFEDEDLTHLVEPKCENLQKNAIDFSDGVVKGEENLNDDIWDYVTQKNTPKLEYHSVEEISENYASFYFKELLEEES
jgi:starch synthase